MKTIRALSVSILMITLLLAPGFNKVQAQSAGCVTSSPSSGGYAVTLCFVSPTDGATLSGEATTSVTLSVTGTSPGVRRVVFYLNGEYLLTDYQSPYTFILPTFKWQDGNQTLAVEALMRDSYVTQRASTSAIFSNGIATPPVNTQVFQPSSGSVPVNGAPFTVAVAGDGASGEANATAVSNLMYSLAPNLVIYTGDVYEKGSFAEFYNWYGTPTTNFGRFWSITNPTIGNHEYENGVAPGYFDYWNNVPNYYSYDAGGWHFISLNSNSAFEPVDPSSAQYQWLSQDLTANSQACTIVYFHHPLFNIGPEGSKPAMIDFWQLLAQNGVSVVLTGHDHTYQRWLPLNGNGQVDPNGITEFVVGASGHGTQTILTSDSRVAYAIDTNPTAFGALFLQLNASGVGFSYRNTSGAILDSGVIPCAKAGPDSQPPTTPENLAVSVVSPTRADLSWTAASDGSGVAGYTIYRDGAALTTVGASVLSYSDTGLQPNSTYSFSVDAFDAAGNHSSAAGVVSASTPAMPPSLTFITTADTYVNAGSATSNYGSAISLRLDASPDLHSYVRFNVQGLAGTPISSAHLKVFTNSSSSLGINVVRVSDNSWGELSMNYNNAPALGSSLGSSGGMTTGSWVSLDVSPYINGEGVYTFGITTNSTTALSLQSRESGGNPAQLVLDLQTSAPDTQPPSAPTALTAAANINPLVVNLGWAPAFDNTSVAGYTLFRDGAAIAVLAGDVLAYSDSDVAPVTSYGYTVDAFDLAGNHSEVSAPAVVVTPDTLAPSAPTGLTALAAGSTQVDLSWDAASDNVGVTGYTLYRDGMALATLAADPRVFSDTSVLNGLTYNYSVEAVDAAGNHSVQSAVASVTLPDTQPPATPEGLTATASSATQVDLAWNAAVDNAGIGGYTLYRDGFTLVTLPGSTLSYSDQTVTPATGYSYSVDAFDLAGNTSAAAIPVWVTTPTLPANLTFVPAADAYISSAKPNTNYGRSTTLRVDGSPILNSYLRFNVQGLNGRTITNARLLIYVSNNSKKGLALFSVADTSWDELAINYTNAPPLGAALGSSAAVKAGTWVSYDVTAVLTGEGSYSFGVAGLDSTAVGFSSRETPATAPQLIIDLQ